VGDTGTAVKSRPAMALGGIPKVTIAGSSLRYTIGLFNIEHLRGGGSEG